jgi:uncharacterized protein
MADSARDVDRLSEITNVRETERIRQALMNAERIVFAYLFGSRVKGTARSSSDFDIAVYLEEGSDFGEEKLDTIGRLTEALHSDDVDVVILNTAPLALVGRILQNRKVVVDRKPFFRHSFESLNIRQFLDFSQKEHAILSRRYGLG